MWQSKFISKNSLTTCTSAHRRVAVRRDMLIVSKWGSVSRNPIRTKNLRWNDGCLYGVLKMVIYSFFCRRRCCWVIRLVVWLVLQTGCCCCCFSSLLIIHFIASTCEIDVDVVFFYWCNQDTIKSMPLFLFLPIFAKLYL